MNTGKKRYINTAMRDDSFFIELDPIEKLLFMYFLSNPLTNVAGIYEISVRRIAFDTGIDKEMVIKIIKRFEERKKVLYYDGYIILLNSYKHQNLENEKIKKGIKRILDGLPQSLIDKIGPMYDSSMTYIGPSNNFNLNFNLNSNLNLDFNLNQKKYVSSETNNIVNNTKSDDFEKKISDDLVFLEKKDEYKEKKREDIDFLIETLKNYCFQNNISYDKTMERNFGKHIMEAKDYGAFVQSIGQDRVEFALNILKASIKINYWKGVCSGPMKIYQNYSEVYNKTKMESSKKKSTVGFLPSYQG